MEKHLLSLETTAIKRFPDAQSAIEDLWNRRLVVRMRMRSLRSTRPGPELKFDVLKFEFHHKKKYHKRPRSNIKQIIMTMLTATTQVIPIDYAKEKNEYQSYEAMSSTMHAQHLKSQYDHATWRMYHRITTARRKQQQLENERVLESSKRFESRQVRTSAAVHAAYFNYPANNEIQGGRMHPSLLKDEMKLEEDDDDELMFDLELQ